MRSAAIALMSLCVPVGVLVGACKGEPVAPVRVSDQEPAIEPKVRPERTGPFGNPNTNPPKVRQGAQLDAEALTAVTTKAREYAIDGRIPVAIETLHGCANRIPQSVECEGELALLLFEHGTRLAEAKYYLDEAAMAEPKHAAIDLYRRMGHMGIARARFDAARAALSVVTKHESATSDDFVDYARALRQDPNRIEEAATAYEQASALAPENYELLEDRATLYERSGDYARAVELLEAYVEATQPVDRKQEILAQRLERLKARAQTP